MRAENISRFIDVNDSAGELAMNGGYLDKEWMMQTVHCSMSSHCSAGSGCRRLL